MPTTLTFTDNPFSDVRGVTYNADIYCVPCGVSAYLGREGLEGHGLSHVAQDALERLGISRFGSDAYGDERNWDSGDFPKVILKFSEPETCSNCGVTF